MRQENATGGDEHGVWILAFVEFVPEVSLYTVQILRRFCLVLEEFLPSALRFFT